MKLFGIRITTKGWCKLSKVVAITGKPEAKYEIAMKAIRFTPTYCFAILKRVPKGDSGVEG